MCDKFESIRNEVVKIMTSNFEGYHFDFMEDPEDESVIYINLYDVDESDACEFKRRIRTSIRDKFRELVLIVPSIISHEDTKTCYEQYLRVREPMIEIDNPDAHLHLDLAQRLQYLVGNRPVESEQTVFSFYNWIGDRMIEPKCKPRKERKNGECRIYQCCAA